MAKSRLHFVHRVPKSLSIDDSNHSEELRLKITWTRVIKSRIPVNIIQVLHRPGPTFRSRVTNNNFLNSRFNQLITHYENTPVRPVRPSTKHEMVPWEKIESVLSQYRIQISYCRLQTRYKT